MLELNRGDTSPVSLENNYIVIASLAFY